MRNLHTMPISLRDANAFVAAKHRHHPPARGCKFVLAAENKDGVVIGVAITSRPVARGFNPRCVTEVVRLCTDGSPNACSLLYGACARIAREMGFEKIITYILASEPGTSLKAAGWVAVATVKGGSWDRPSRPRTDKSPTVDKVRYEKILKVAA